MKITPREQWQISKYFWMSLAGVFLYLAVAYVQGLIEAPAYTLWFIVVAAIVEGGTRNLLRWWRGGQLGDRANLLFTYCDLLLITLGIAISGGVHSDLWLLFFMTMIVESLYLSGFKKRLLDVQMTLFYLAATLPRQFDHAHADPAGIYARVFGIHLFFLIMVTAIARRLSVQYADRGAELALLREQRATSDERARIAREVHDSLGHALVGCILRLELAQRLISRRPEEAETVLKEEIPALRGAWNEGRDLAFHLRPWEQELEGENLPDLLTRHIRRFSGRTGMSIELEVEGSEWQLRPLVLLGLSRIVQEALTNAARHGEATEAVVRLSRLPHRIGKRDRLVCQIRDNGKGFKVPVAELTGVGLASMQERAAALGGTWSLLSEPGAGTHIRVEVPF